jgi:small subunit ribosomal protein S6
LISGIFFTFAAAFSAKKQNNNKMNSYETVFIATPVLSDAQTKELLGKFQGIITENGGQIVSTEEWGLRKLEYPIQKKSTGFYFLVEFQGEGPIVEALETQYRRDERVIRFLTFRLDKDAVEWAEKRRAKLAGRAHEAKAEAAAKVESHEAPVTEPINTEEE